MSPKTLLPLVILLLAPLGSAACATSEEEYDDEDYGKPMLGIKMTLPNARVQVANHLEPNQGVLVRKVYPGTAADDMGIRPGDIVMEVNGAQITSMTDLRDVVANNAVGDPARVTVRRGGQDIGMESYYGDWPEGIPYLPINPEAERRYRDNVMRDLVRRSRRLDGLRRLREKLEDEIRHLRQADSAAHRALAARSPAALADFAALAGQRELIETLQSEGFSAPGLPAWRFRYRCLSGPAPESGGLLPQRNRGGITYGFGVDSEAL